MAVRVGINGFGRIGRNVFRAAYEQGADIEKTGRKRVTALRQGRGPGRFLPILRRWRWLHRNS